MEENGTNKPMKLSWIGKVFDWIDFNILSRSTRLWMYLLEILGIVAICIIIYQFNKGLNLIVAAKTDFEIKKAKMFVDAVKSSAGPISAMVATICGALPSIMGIFRSLKVKWANGHGTNGTNGKKEIQQISG
jgi:hypothetical protein